MFLFRVGGIVGSTVTVLVERVGRCRVLVHQEEGDPHGRDSDHDTGDRDQEQNPSADFLDEIHRDEGAEEVDSWSGLEGKEEEDLQEVPTEIQMVVWLSLMPAERIILPV